MNPHTFLMYTCTHMYRLCLCMFWNSLHSILPSRTQTPVQYCASCSFLVQQASIFHGLCWWMADISVPAWQGTTPMIGTYSLVLVSANGVPLLLGTYSSCLGDSKYELVLCSRMGNRKHPHCHRCHAESHFH